MGADPTIEFGINQIVVKNPNSGTPAKYYFEALTRGGVSIRREINVYTILDSQILIEKLEQPPIWANFDETNSFTKSVKNYWENP